MDGLCNKLLTRSTFACYQNSRTRWGNSFNQAKDILHYVRAADKSVAVDRADHRLTQGLKLLFLAAFFNGSRNESEYLLILKWLADDADCSLFPSRNGGVERRIGRYHQHCGLWVDLD